MGQYYLDIQAIYATIFDLSSKISTDTVCPRSSRNDQ